MLEQLRTGVINRLQDAYTQNKAPELNGTPPHSPEFFDTWYTKGIVPAFHGLVNYVEVNGINSDNTIQAKWDAFRSIVGCTILATGLGQYAQKIKDDATNPELNLGKKSTMLVYDTVVGWLMAAQAGGNEESVTGSADNYDPQFRHLNDPQQPYNDNQRRFTPDEIRRAREAAKEKKWAVTRDGVIMYGIGGKMTYEQAKESLKIP